MTEWMWVLPWIFFGSGLVTTGCAVLIFFLREKNMRDIKKLLESSGEETIARPFREALAKYKDSANGNP